jgi:16S rRNA (guanine966-N2)-methyltransferase
MLRITSGEFRGRFLKSPKGILTRPTQARLRQALFNSIQTTIPQAKVLDLFAGSGALGFESLSRGASHVTFVENSRAALKTIEENAKDLQVLDRIEIISDSVERLIPLIVGKNAPYDLVLADPPYIDGWEMKMLEELKWPWEEVLVEAGMFCLEWGNQKSQVDFLPEKTGFLVKVREKNYGDSVLTTYTRT